MYLNIMNKRKVPVQYLCLDEVAIIYPFDHIYISSSSTSFAQTAHRRPFDHPTLIHYYNSIRESMASTMAKQFLAQILTIDNTVKSEDSQDCIICHEKCGTLSQETGTIELEVRLPCKHAVSSAVSHPLPQPPSHLLLIMRSLVHYNMAF